MLSLVFSSVISGVGTQKIGYYVPSMLLAPCIMCIGEGLLTTLRPDSAPKHWIAYQFLTGFGVGFGMQTAGLAAQTVLPRPDIPTGVSLMFFVQQLGGAIGTTVAQAVFSNVLVRDIMSVPGLAEADPVFGDASALVKSGATDLITHVADKFPGFLADVVGAYNNATTKTFLAALIMSAVALVCALPMEWKSIKQGSPRGPSGPPGGPGGPPAAPGSLAPAGGLGQPGPGAHMPVKLREPFPAKKPLPVEKDGLPSANPSVEFLEGVKNEK